MAILESHALTKTYRGKRKKEPIRALTDFSLSVPEGEIFGLLGPNGAGKTTFIKLLLSIVYPSSGDANLFGSPISDESIKARIGYLPENHRYPPHLTAEQVLNYFGKLSGITASELPGKIDKALATVDMTKWRNEKIKKYSKGMQQRIGLAQALINDPDLIILDEPTDGVDPLGRKQIRDLLVYLRGQGKTVFLNSHLLSEVELICDRVAILNKGKLLKLGSVEELTQSEQEYAIGFEGEISESLQMQWDATRMQVRLEEQSLRIVVEALDQLNTIIDQLRQEGVLITSIVQKRSTLEESFLKVIGDEQE